MRYLLSFVAILSAFNSLAQNHDDFISTPDPEYAPAFINGDQIIFFSDRSSAQIETDCVLTVQLGEFTPPVPLPGFTGKNQWKHDAESRQQKGGGTCGSDTIEYPLWGKATALEEWEIDGTGYIGFGQYYDAPDNINVEGIKVYAYTKDNAFNADTIYAWVKLYDASPVDSMPVGAALDSAEIAFSKDYNVNDIEDWAYTGIFSSPVSVSSAYFVSLEHVGADTLTTISNSTANMDGAGENLGFYNYANVWYRNIDFINFDCDWIIEPIVNYAFQPSFTTDQDTIPGLGINVTTTNTTTPVYTNRMYNQDVPTPYYLWVWGDTNTDNFVDGMHSYSAYGFYDIQLIETLNGWQTSCTDTATKTVAVLAIGMEEQQQDLHFALYPNPATTDVTIGFEGTSGQLRIYDTAGRLYDEMQVNNSTVTLELYGYVPGIYLFELTTEKQRGVKRLIIR